MGAAPFGCRGFFTSPSLAGRGRRSVATPGEGRSLIIRALTLAATLVACRAPAPATPLTDALLAVAEEEAADLPFDASETERELALLTRRAQARLDAGDPLPVALREAVFGASAFAREVDDDDLGFVLLPQVLADRRGGCVGLGTLYLALAERLGRPDALAGVLVPGHFFVRAREGAANLELLRQGEVMPDAFYDKYLAGRARTAAHMRPLLPAEAVAVVRFDIGNERRRQGRLPEAIAAYAAAAAAFPGFAEAHASLGLALQLVGRLPEARAAYDRAATIDPDLPGLTRNLELLEQAHPAPR